MIHFYSANTSQLKWYQKPFNLSWLIKLFTHWELPEIPFEEIFTHVSIGEDVTISGRRLIFESYLVQMLNPYDNPKLTAHFVSNHSQVSDREIFWDIIGREHGKPYGFLQLIDFVRSWLWNKIFKRDPKNVWFPSSSVCSELGYTASEMYGRKYSLLVLRAKLMRYNSNFYSPMRLYRILSEAEKSGEVIFEVNK